METKTQSTSNVRQTKNLKKINEYFKFKKIDVITGKHNDAKPTGK